MTSRPSTRPTPPLDTAGARTLPAAAYVDPAVLEAEKARICRRTWQLVADVSDLLRPGDFVSVTVLDQPVVVVRGLDESFAASTTSAVTAPDRSPSAEGTGRASSAATTARPTGSTAHSARAPGWRARGTSTRPTSASCRSGWTASGRSSA